MIDHLSAPRAATNPYAELKATNSALLRREIAERRSVLRALPEIVTLNSTDICNLRCVMCPRSVSQGKFRLADDVVRVVAEELFPTAVKANLTTAGGEPLGVGFGTILEHARRFHVAIDINTNGLLLTAEKFRDMRPVLDHLNVSVDCSVPEIYERIRAGSSYDQLVDRLELIERERADGRDAMLFSLSAIMMASNLPHLAEFVRFAARFGVDGITVQQLSHDIKPTYEEEPTRFYSDEEIERFLVAAEEAARETGIAMFTAGMGRPPVVPKPIRDKFPNPIDGSGACYFLTQSFSVMYSGEVYPCCKPTDYKLGDVRFESALDVWNGAPLVALREAHYERKGSLFCSGCEYAPHLEAKPLERARAILRTGRRAFGHVANNVTRRWSERTKDFRVHGLEPPAHRRVEGSFGVASESSRARTVASLGSIESGDVRPSDGAFVFVEDGEIRVANHELGSISPLGRVESERGGYCWLAAFVDAGVMLVAFERSGEVLRIDTNSAELRPEVVLRYDDPTSFARREGFARDGSGRAWIGEYGVDPGARGASIHRISARGQAEECAYLPHVRHVHAVAWDAFERRLVATTGDIGMERATWIAERGDAGLVRRLAPWAGFTAVLPARDHLHFGTDMSRGNGLVRQARDASAMPEFRPFPAEFDLNVRRLEVLADGRLLAFLGLDRNLVADDDPRRPTVLVSRDDGGTWEAVYRCESSWELAPEELVVLDRERGRVALVGTADAHVLEL